MVENKTKVYIIISALIILFIGWKYFSFDDLDESFNNSNRSNNFDNISVAYTNHHIFLKTYIYCKFNRLTNESELMNKLYDLQVNISESLTDDPQEQDKVSDLLQSQLTSLINFMTAIRDDDVGRDNTDYLNIIKRTSITRLYNDIDKLCILLAKIRGIDGGKLKILYHDYYGHLNSMIMAQNHGLFEEDVANTTLVNGSLLTLISFLS